jgi:hypothetical protein
MDAIRLHKMYHILPSDDYQFYFKVDSMAYFFLEKTCTSSTSVIIIVIIYLPKHARGRSDGFLAG